MKIASRSIGPDRPPYVIAELGVNHDGCVERAIDLVKASAAAGAEAIKLQHFRAGRLLGRGARLADYQRRSGQRDVAAMLGALELGRDDLRRVIAAAHDLGLHAIITAFSVELVPELCGLAVDAFKTASPDIINRPLIDALRATGRPLVLSTGAATLEEVATAVTWLEGTEHVLLHCVSAYPTPDEDAHLNGRRALGAVSDRALGYSDHTTAVDTGALAVAGGACVLEKHVTHDRRAPGPDHAASLEPTALAEYVRLARRAWRMTGPVRKDVLAIEREVREVSRQSITAAVDLPAGHRLRRRDLTIMRPGTGLSPARLEETIGRTLARRVSAGEPLRERDLAAAVAPSAPLPS